MDDASSFKINQWGGPEKSGFPLSPQAQYENKTYRVVKEFLDGQSKYGYEGLCAKAEQTEEKITRFFSWVPKVFLVVY